MKTQNRVRRNGSAVAAARQASSIKAPAPKRRPVGKGARGFAVEDEKIDSTKPGWSFHHGQAIWRAPHIAPDPALDPSWYLDLGECVNEVQGLSELLEIYIYHQTEGEGSKSTLNKEHAGNVNAGISNLVMNVNARLRAAYNAQIHRNAGKAAI